MTILCCVAVGIDERFHPSTWHVFGGRLELITELNLRSKTAHMCLSFVSQRLHTFCGSRYLFPCAERKKPKIWRRKNLQCWFEHKRPARHNKAPTTADGTQNNGKWHCRNHCHHDGVDREVSWPPILRDLTLPLSGHHHHLKRMASHLVSS